MRLILNTISPFVSGFSMSGTCDCAFTEVINATVTTTEVDSSNNIANLLRYAIANNGVLFVNTYKDVYGCFTRDFYEGLTVLDASNETYKEKYNICYALKSRKIKIQLSPA
jgi:hypothetical protein